MKAILRTLLLFALLLPWFSRAEWRPCATVPEAQGPEEGCYFGDWITIDGKARPESPLHFWLWRQKGRLMGKIEVVEPRMAGIRMEKKERDSAVWEDDAFDIFLYPADGHVYHLIFNALGTIYDERDGQGDWNGNWQIKTTRELYRWTAEFSIPFQDLGGEPEEGSEWRMQMGVCRTTTTKQGGISGWVAVPETRRFKDGYGIIRFVNAPHPLEKIPGSENAAAPEYRWSGQEPRLVRIGTDPAGTEYLCHRMEYQVDGTPVYGVYFLKRASQVANILGDTIERLRAFPSPDVKAMIRGAEALMALQADDTPEVYDLLEEEARRIRDRMLYLLARKTMEEQGRKSEEIVFGTLDSLTRLLPVDVFPQERIGAALSLDAGRNEQEAAQVVLFAGDANLTLVEASLEGPLVSAEGGTIPVEAMEIRRVGHVLTTTPEYDADYVGLYPDILLPLGAFDVPAQGRETLWFSVKVPEDTPPGVYQGKLLLKARNSLPTPVPVQLQVRSFTIPRHSSLISAFGVWPLNGETKKLMNRYGFTLDLQAAYEMMFAHRLTPYFITESPTLQKKPYLKLEEGDALVLEVESCGDGNLEVALFSDEGDYARLHFSVAAGASRLECPAPREALDKEHLYAMTITLRGCGGGRLRASLARAGESLELIPWRDACCDVKEDGSVSDWAQWDYLAMDPPAVPPEIDWTAYDRQIEWGLSQGMTSHMADLREPLPLWTRILRNHLEEKGWLKYFYTYLADEPVPSYYPVVNALLSTVKKAPGTPSLPNMMTARSFPPELCFVDTWCPETYSYNPELAAAEQAKGRNVWWYVAYGNRDPLPNIWIDSPLAEGRSWIWQSWKHDLDGILYWSVNWWGRRNPWATGAVFNDVSNGDGNLIYPTPSGVPLSSPRLEVLTDGLEDYELFCLLEASLDALGEKNPQLSRRIRELLSVNPEVVVSWKEYSRDPQVILAERRRLMDCLDEAVAFLGEQPAITRRPVRRTGLTPDEVAGNLTRYQEKLDEQSRERARKAQEKLDGVKRPGDLSRPGLVLAYDFEGDAPLLWDRSGNGLDSGYAGLSKGEGHSGQGLRTSPGSGLALPPSAAILGSRPAEGTVAFWVRPLTDQGSTAFIPVIFYLMATDRNWTPSGMDEIGIYVEDDKLKARICGEGTRNPILAEIPNPLKKGEWSHLALTWKAGERRLYVNGVEAGSSLDPFVTPWLDGFPGSLGSHPCNLYSKERTFFGDYDDLLIYRRCLAPEEIQALSRP
ncbi:MAG: glycoside hydrolase domain-containing protein [Oligosphaeraceae bacterium]